MPPSRTGRRTSSWNTYLEGEDLRSSLQRRGRFSVPDAVDCVLQASEAIAEAHAAGVVHRDLKPGNLFACRRRDGSQLVKVLDFGVSKLLRKSEITQQQHGLSTGPHVMMGSPLYSSPEQIRASNAVDARSDIWALGAILYELVSGRPPFHGATLLELCSNVMRAAAPPLTAVLPGLPPAFEAVVARSLEKARSRRFGTIAEFARALAPFAPSRSLLSVERIENVIRTRATSGVRDAAPLQPPPAMPPCDRTLPSERDPASGTRSREEERRSVLARRALWIGIAMTLGAIAVATALFIAPSRSQRAVPVATPAPAPQPPAAAWRPPPEPAITLAPIIESAASPVASPRSVTDGRKPPPRPRAPDTSEFGGLQ